MMEDTWELMRLVESLEAGEELSREEFARLLSRADAAVRAHATERAVRKTHAAFGNKIYLRGLIEFTNYCRNNCLYCGIRSGNRRVERYRLDRDGILAAAARGAELGFRTFVLQGGEDSWYDDECLVDIVRSLRSAHPDSAITLSAGERSRASYERLFQAGANRYLLRHETADPEHYAMLHPASMSLDARKECLFALKEIGYQTGSGFMVGSPYQTAAHIAQDLLFLRSLGPEMVGIGPFLPHQDTPFRSFPPGEVDLTLFIISLVRLMLPHALIPATTALGSAESGGRERGILAGANVVMPNLSPPGVRSKYSLYDGKLHTDLEAAENVRLLEDSMENIGYRVVKERGDYES